MMLERKASETSETFYSKERYSLGIPPTVLL